MAPNYFHFHEKQIRESPFLQITFIIYSKNRSKPVSLELLAHYILLGNLSSGKFIKLRKKHLRWFSWSKSLQKSKQQLTNDVTFAKNGHIAHISSAVMILFCQHNTKGEWEKKRFCEFWLSKRYNLYKRSDQIESKLIHLNIWLLQIYVRSHSILIGLFTWVKCPIQSTVLINISKILTDNKFIKILFEFFKPKDLRKRERRRETAKATRGYALWR